MKHIVIIGSSIAGQSTAFNLREQNERVRISLVSDEDAVLYDRHLLFHYLAGRIEEEKLFLCTPDLYRQKNISFIADARVAAVQTDKKTVSVRKGQILHYDALIIASGVRPALPEIRGARKPGVNVFFNLADARELRNRIFTEPICVVGRDLFSLETARALAERFRQEVKLIADLNGQHVCGDKGVEVIATPLDEIIGEGHVQAIRLAGGKVIGVGAVIFADSRGSMDFLKGTSLLDTDGSLRTDGEGSTQVPGIYACTTAAEGRSLASLVLQEMENVCQNSS